MKFNERVWTGHVISWIQECIREGLTFFQDATSDASIKLESGKTKFPDILLFLDKTSGLIFNGWELKFPDTEVDDEEMLLNALEKAERIKSDSLVTWNGAEAIIWKIENEDYKINSLTKVKVFPKEPTINSRDDLAEPIKYRGHEKILKSRLFEIIHDLEQLYKNGDIRPAINISNNIIDAIKNASEIITPQFQKEITNLKGSNATFRSEFNIWKIYERSTLKILASSSRRQENVIEEEVLAKFTFYNLIGKILFYLTLSENLSGNLNRIKITNQRNIKLKLQSYFEEAQKINYHAVFMPYFTDDLEYSRITNIGILKFLDVFTEFDFKILPTDVIGEILENLVPKEEKQKFGQYFTPEILANLISFPAIQTNTDKIFDPTSGTGTFLNSFYNILNFHGNVSHTELLNQIWGNDISHFPAILSVINLYKQSVTNTDNFPRITRNDFFNLNPGDIVVFPDSRDYTVHIERPIPTFDAIVSNFPFIQQEDIPNEILTTLFRKHFEVRQQAFLLDKSFKINERSDYFTYCVYNSIRFLNADGFLSFITSNAWLGKEYGIQFKKFLLDNFHIKYVVKSSVEHWFSDSKVSTIFTVLQLKDSSEPTKFIKLNFKLDEHFDIENINNQLSQIENFYADIDNCSHSRNDNWRNDNIYPSLYHRIDNSVTVSVIEKEELVNSLSTQNNWGQYFISSDILQTFEKNLIELYPNIIDSFRGERTGWNPMFIIPRGKIEQTRIETDFLIPYVKSPSEFKKIEFSEDFNFYLFVCDLPLEELRTDYPGAYNWINSFTDVLNRNGTKTIPEVCDGHSPYWYSLRPKTAHIITAINPYERLFFGYSLNPITVDQRLVSIRVNNDFDVQLIAALLNSVVTLLTIELKGTSRNLGALDLNANYFKLLKVLNPQNLSSGQKTEIIDAFEPLTCRAIATIFEEITRADRINFDKTILNMFGVNEKYLSAFYELLTSFVYERVTLKNA